MTVYVQPPDVGVVVEDTGDGEPVTVYLASLPDGPVQILNGVASLIWLEATAPDEQGELADRVAALVDRSPEDVRADVDAFVKQLVNAGYLERRDA